MNFSANKWHMLTLAEQLGNVGSDFDRALKWKAKKQQTLFMNAATRTLEQLDMTLSDSKHRGWRRREVARARESVCSELFSETINPSSAQNLSNYFLSMASLARKQTLGAKSIL